MLHLANSYIRSNVIVGEGLSASDVTQIAFTRSQISCTKTELAKDGVSYLYSSLVSFIDGLHGFSQGFYSWPTVKFYYCVFYALRSYLSVNNICLFYVGKKAYSIDLTSQLNARKEDGNTHKMVLDIFKRTYPSHILLTQEIELKHPFDWLIELREFSNYKNPKFCEPNLPFQLMKIASMPLEQVLASYRADDRYLYAFDREHACIAYPLKIIEMVLSEYKRKEIFLPESDVECIRLLLSRIDGAENCFSDFIVGL